MKEVLIVSIGSFFGGGLRYWISKMVQSCSLIAFPFGTMTVNVLGCFIIVADSPLGVFYSFYPSY